MFKIYLVLLLLMFLTITCGCQVEETAKVLPEEPAEEQDLQVKEQVIVEKVDLFNRDNFTYLGAFRLPECQMRPNTFAYGGEAMTYNPDGNPDEAVEDFPGTLFIMGHNRMPYGELPDGNRVAEVTIPMPVISNRISDLNRAEYVQTLQVIDNGIFAVYDEIPRVGMEYCDTPATGPLIHLAWGQHLHQPERDVASHAWFSPDLSRPNTQGPWYIGHESHYSVNDYIFSIPPDWAEQYTEGRPLATGRFKDGGWSGMGPSLFAYQPWDDDHGTPAPVNSRLQVIALLLYESSVNNPNIEKNMNLYQHPDEWTGGAWLTNSTGKSAVLFAGTKSTGDIYWYGFINPEGPEYACVEGEFLGQFTLCRFADGIPCPNETDLVCYDYTSNRGWWSSSFEACFILYDPSDLAMVALGQMEPWEPQPYAYIELDNYLFLNPSKIEVEMLGAGLQRRYRLGDVAYDRVNGLLYVLELFADEANPVVHVWRVQ